MVKVQYSGDKRDKIDFILQTAQNRFGMYGLEKTTMREIAGDVGMSKASLYYYFPDKVSLFHAVIKKEQDDFFKFLDESRRKLMKPDQMLEEYIHVRNVYFRTFINLSKLRLNAMKELRPVMRDLIEDLKARELRYIRGILITGRETNDFRDIDEEIVASVFLDSLQGIRRTYLGRSDLSGLETLNLEDMEKKMAVFYDLFINGITGKAGAGSGKG
ncbi:MAG TPA: TetR/AcrR family transcriptional regulator [Bacteroidales bacterium]|nr:TetR/AcrR family transcriptional regulator [Bacteroidales bacterium]